MKTELSNCCNSPFDICVGDESTGCYICQKCKKGCDPVEELTARQFAVKAIHEDKLNVKNPSILAKLLNDYAQSLLSKKLKEQRDLCAKEWNLNHGYKFSGLYEETVMDEIKNAPEPTQ